MQPGLLFLPCLVLLLLTVFALLTMLRGRRVAVRAGEISAAYFKTYDTGEKLPRKVRQADRSYHNLVESTPPFYFICATAMALGRVDAILLGLAWAYVAMRVVHAFVHMTSNRIPARSMTFAVAWVVMLAMAVKLAIGILV
jgi:hypothetical protein